MRWKFGARRRFDCRTLPVKNDFKEEGIHSVVQRTVDQQNKINKNNNKRSGVIDSHSLQRTPDVLLCGWILLGTKTPQTKGYKMMSRRTITDIFRQCKCYY